MNEKNKFIIHVLVIIAMAAIVIVALQSNKFPEPENQFSVQGEGSVFAPPDIAQISLGVKVEEERTAEAATKKGVEKMNQVIRAIKDAGVEEKDLKTTAYNLYPSYDYTKAEGRELTGWNLDQSVQVKIRELDKIGDVIAKATQSGANQAGGVSFTIDDEEELKSQARAKAIEDAKAKAKELSKQAGLNLGKVINVFESQTSYPQPYFARAESLDTGFGGGIPAPDIQTGENEVIVNVTLIYEVE
jgi:uncharacterized protein